MLEWPGFATYGYSTAFPMAEGEALSPVPRKRLMGLTRKRHMLAITGSILGVMLLGPTFVHFYHTAGHVDTDVIHSTDLNSVREAQEWHAKFDEQVVRTKVIPIPPPSWFCISDEDEN